MNKRLTFAYLLFVMSIPVFATEKPDISKIPEPKLVAEYKFNSPISDAVFFDNGKPKVVATEAFIRFYNPDGSIRKEIKTKDIKHKENGRIVNSRETAQISKNGEYVAVIHNVKMGVGWVKYLDRNGKILFEKEHGIGYFRVSPNGLYLVFYGPEGTEFVDFSGDVLANYEFIKCGGEFSKNSNYYVVSGAILGKQKIFLFGENGKKVILQKELPFDVRFMTITEDGNSFAVGGVQWDKPKMKILKAPLYVFSPKRLIWTKDDISQAVFLNDEIIIVASRNHGSNRMFYLYSLKGDKLGGINPEPFGNDISSIGGPTQAAIYNGGRIIIYLMYSGNDYKPETIHNYVVIYNIDSGRFAVKKYSGLGGADDPNFIAMGESISLAGKYLVIRGSKVIRVFEDFIK